VVRTPRDGGDDPQLVTLPDLASKAFTPFHVVVVEEEIHVLADLATLVQDALVDARVNPLEGREDIADGGFVDLERDLGLAARERAQRSGDAHGDLH
jgi:hypothetical protein